MNINRTLIAIAAFGALTGIAQAADVETILGRGTPIGTVNVERLLVTGTSVDKVLGRAGFVVANPSTAKFAVGSSARRAIGTSAVDRLGRG